MIAHITHGNSFGGVLDYLTNEVAKELKKSSVKSATEPSPQSAAEAPEKSHQGLLTGDEILRGKTVDGHSQYPRRSFADDLSEEYQANRRWRIIGGNLSDDPKAAAKELNSIVSSRPDILKPVWHASLSAPPNEKITTQQWRAIGRRFLNEMGFKDVPFLIVQHRDQEQDHVHIVTSRVDVFGDVNDAWRERYRAQMACVKIEEEFGLKKAPRAKAERTEKKKQTYSKDSAMTQVQEKVEAILTGMDKPNVAEFVNQLEANQVLVGTKFSPDGEVWGLSFAVPEEKSRHAYLERKRRKEARERKAQAKLIKSIEKTNAESEKQPELITGEEEKKPHPKASGVIAFQGAELGDKYSWKNLKNQLEYAPPDDALLAAANDRAKREEFRPVQRIEIKKPETLVVETPVLPEQDIKPAPLTKAAEAISPPPRPAEKKSFLGKIQAYLPPRVLDFIQSPVESSETVSADCPPVKPDVQAAENDSDEKGKYRKLTPTLRPPISDFDLAMEKQRMAAEISEIFHVNSQKTYQDLAEEILETNDQLRAKSIYSEFFFDGHLIRGIRFSKCHYQTGETITFKGSELNIVSLETRGDSRHRVKNQPATPKNLFAACEVSPEWKDKLIEASRLPRRSDEKKVNRSTVFEANAIDEKVNRVFEKQLVNSLLNDVNEGKSLEILDLMKFRILKKEETAPTDEQKERIEGLRVEIDAERRAHLRELEKPKTKKFDNGDEFADAADYRRKKELFNRSLKSGLDAECLIVEVVEEKELTRISQETYDQAYRGIWRYEEMPPPNELAQAYIKEFFDRARTADSDKPSDMFVELLKSDMNATMLQKTHVQPGVRFTADEPSDFLTPGGVPITQTVEKIKETNDWKKYSFDESRDSRLAAAVFVLTNGSREQKDDLLDRHRSDLQKREAEIIAVRQQTLIEENTRSRGVTHLDLER